MKSFNSIWNTKARPIYRVVSFIIGLVSLSMGILGFAEYFHGKVFEFNSDVKFYIAAIAMGLFFFVVAIRGGFFIKSSE